MAKNDDSGEDHSIDEEELYFDEREFNFDRDSDDSSSRRISFIVP